MANSRYEIVPMNNVLEGMDKPFTLKNGLTYSVKQTELTKYNQCNEVIAIDTETLKGTCRLLCISGFDFQNSTIKKIKWFNIRPNSIYKPTFDSCLRMMTFHINNKGCYRFFWNLDFDIQAILKLYDKPDKIQFIDFLSKGIPMRYKDFRGVEYEFKWIRSKLFSIQVVKSKKSVVWTDLIGFYNLGLGKASEKYLKLSKLKDVNAKLLNESKEYWKNVQYDAIKYCIRDSELTCKLGFIFIDGLMKQEILLSKFLVSPASLSKANYRFNNRIPNLSRTPIEIVQIAYDTYFGGHFEIYKRGWFDWLYLYDIVSEYPFYMKDLPDMFSGIWIRRKKYDGMKSIQLPIKQPLLAFYKVKLDIPYDVKVSTIPFKNKSIVSFLVGKLERWFTWFDIDLMREYIVEIIDSYEYVIPKGKKVHYPFRQKTNELSEKKKKIDKQETPVEYNGVKLTMNATYGCTIERHLNIFLEKDKNGNLILDKEGKPIESKRLKGGILFNPIYASHITSFGRWKLFKDTPKEKWNNIIGVHTDSIITNVPFEHLDIGKNLGQWDLETQGKGIIINTGMYQIGYMVKSRGIPKKLIKNWLRFCLKYSQLDKKEFTIERMRKVRQALIQDKSLTFMNTMKDVKRSVSIDSDTKRTWNDDFKDFDDMLSRNIDSLPLVLVNDDIEPNPLKYGIDLSLFEQIINNQNDLI